MTHAGFRRLLGGLFSMMLSIASAQSVDRPLLLQAGDKTAGEDEAIRRRIEWFEDVRGLDAHPEARAQRAAAVALLRQQVAAGVPALAATENWQSLGPDGMTMLNWEMGRVIGRVTALAVDPADYAFLSQQPCLAVFANGMIMVASP